MSEPSTRSTAAYRLIPLALLLLAGILFMALGGHRYLTFAALAEHREFLRNEVARSGGVAVGAFILCFAGVIALSLPGGALFTIASGFLFGPFPGTVYAVVGATTGAIVLFLAARAGFAGLAARAGPWAQRLEAGFRANGLNYLLVLRLIPIFPFSMVNLVAAAVGLPLPVFVFGTVVGMIPATFVFASLGSGFGALLAEGRSPDLGIMLQPAIIAPILGLAGLVLLPVLYKGWRTSRDSGIRKDTVGEVKIIRRRNGRMLER